MKTGKNLTGRLLAAILCVALTLSLMGCQSQPKSSTALDPKNPVTVTVWNYYNGDQLAAFDQLVEDFNATVGTEKGVVVLNVSQSDINTLSDSLIASVEGKAGAQEKPTLAAVYAETAYILNQAGALEPLDAYFTTEELANYVTGFLNEGRFGEGDKLMLFPILKSTELFTANRTDWAPFAEASGIRPEDVTTKEKLAEAAKAYYEWTDGLTPDVPEDGKALYGRDSVANYVFTGSYQLGHELFKVENGKLSVDLNRDTFKTLWDNYYVPFINGYFGAYARFRSEDCKTGKILAMTSSSSSMGYLPTAVTLEDDTTHDIEMYIVCDLPFGGAKTAAVTQQGASYCMLKGTPAQQEGAVTFLKWFTEPDRNLSFALLSGYSPVRLEANSRETITKAYSGETDSAKGKNLLSGLLASADAFRDNTSYATKPFQGSKDVRGILGDSLEKQATADREAVLAAIAGGATRGDAVAEYVTDEYFDAWFDSLCQQVNAAVK